MDAEPPPVAVLFARITGSVALQGTLGDGAALEALNRSLAGLKASVENHQGSVVKTVGEDLIAQFGHADLALRAANAMQAFMRGQTDGLALQVGFTYGAVIYDRQDIFGDTVNLAARIASLANPKQILTTRQAVDRLSPFLRSLCRSLFATTVKGKAEKVSVHEVLWQQDKGTTVVGAPDQKADAGPTSLTLRCRSRTWTLDEAHDTLVAGRDPACDIIVTGDNVSRHHARIFMRQGKFVLADQSANGTYVRVHHRQDTFIHREEFVLLGQGGIGLGQAVADCGDDAIAYEVG